MRPAAKLFAKLIRGAGARVALVFALSAATVFAHVAPAPQRRARGRTQRATATRTRAARPSAEVRAAVARVSADSLRGHVSFLASDALEGRNAPSRGLDVAAEYVAAQFRRAGLEPAGEAGSYFQTATLTSRREPGVTYQSRNVAAVLRGSDPALRDTYVIVSAHYDHVGVRETAEGEDKIFNGANDNASGTAAVMEIAATLASLKRRPRRSILFVAFTAEEKGLLGSRYYGQHPLVPLEKTVAQVNMEVLGRTDDSEGPQVGTLAVTGFDYSEVGETLRAAGEQVGVRVYKHPTNSDAFFARSDNEPLAALGVPAHTVGAAFMYPDYHRAGDHWEKLDYANMERVVRAVTLGVYTIANDAREPRWLDTNPKAAAYARAWRERRGK
ncbi:MAG TPA: M20/M25/M40 family metallo-hydrolase [Pyrinomonadaceae bacterium]|nr:M20/M25/M40 family metallo-hydrolase [Pyrinomonadaceae bacterium]